MTDSVTIRGASPYHRFQQRTMYMSDSCMVINWGYGIHRTPTFRCFQDSVHHRTPEILDFMAPLCAQVSQQHQLSLCQWVVSNMLIMIVFPALRCTFQPLSGAFKCNLKPSLMLLNPFMDMTMHRVLDSSQQEVNWEPGLLAEHQEKRGLSSRLMGGGVVRVQQLWQTGAPVSLSLHRQRAQQVMKRTIEPFTLTVSGRVIGGGA